MDLTTDEYNEHFNGNFHTFGSHPDSVLQYHTDICIGPETKHKRETNKTNIVNRVFLCFQAESTTKVKIFVT